MSQIYSTAMQVEVWLGLSFEGSDEAMDSLCQAAVDPTSVTAEELADNAFKSKAVAPEELLMHAPAIEKIAHLPYWSRLWIVQELLLSDNVCVRIGNVTAPWPDAFYPTVELPITTNLLYWLLLCTCDLGTIITGEWGRVNSLTHWRECSNVRDFVFALMGLVPEPLRFYPDYSVPLQDILLTLLRSQITAYVSQPSEFFERTPSNETDMMFAVNTIEKCARD